MMLTLPSCFAAAKVRSHWACQSDGGESLAAGGRDAAGGAEAPAPAGAALRPADPLADTEGAAAGVVPHAASTSPTEISGGMFLIFERRTWPSCIADHLSTGASARLSTTVRAAAGMRSSTPIPAGWAYGTAFSVQAPGRRAA